MTEKGEAMTRAEMAQALSDYPRFTGDARALEHAAAAELRKTCATCKHFNRDSRSIMSCTARWYVIPVPADGSGFCHRWEPKQ